MGILSKEQAVSVEEDRFGEEGASEAGYSTMRLASDDAAALPAPDVDATAADEASPAPLTNSSPESQESAQLEQQPVQPIFEIPEEILGGFYEQVIMAGLEDGKSQVLAELNVLQERFAGALDGLAAVSRELASQNQVQLLTLACDIAEKLMRTEIKSNPRVVLQLVQMCSYSSQPRRRWSVQSGDFEYLAAHRVVVDGDGAAFNVRIEQDPELGMEIFVETPKGQVDGRIRSRLSEVEAALNGAVMFKTSDFGLNIDALSDRLEHTGAFKTEVRSQRLSVLWSKATCPVHPLVLSARSLPRVVALLSLKSLGFAMKQP